MPQNNIIENFLPKEVLEICNKLDAPPRLIAHLTIVHDVAIKLIDLFKLHLPKLKFNFDEVIFGSAIHDIGKAVYTNELTNSGNKHEEVGVELLIKFGLSPNKARFAHTHANWKDQKDIKIEDLFVALADNCWKGKRNEQLEMLITNKISIELGEESWEIFLILDEIIQNICVNADQRLDWQKLFSATN